MIKQKATLNKNTYQIKTFKEYDGNRITLYERYDDNGNLIRKYLDGKLVIIIEYDQNNKAIYHENFLINYKVEQKFMGDKLIYYKDKYSEGHFLTYNETDIKIVIRDHKVTLEGFRQLGIKRLDNEPLLLICLTAYKERDFDTAFSMGYKIKSFYEYKQRKISKEYYKITDPNKSQFKHILKEFNLIP